MSTKKAIVIGGSNGIGLAFVKKLIEKGYTNITIFDKSIPDIESNIINHVKVDLTDIDYDIFSSYLDVNTVIITAGFGRVSKFETFVEKEIENSFKVNAIAIVSIIKQYYSKLLSSENMNFLVMGSIAGFVSSPMFSVYSATKSAVCRFVESINVELEMAGSKNRILNVSPGSLKGTKFNGGSNNTDILNDLVDQIMINMYDKKTLYIPQYEEIYCRVLDEYKHDSHKAGISSYNYKLNSGRINNIPQVKIGYLSGTFDLFHVGHLNLLKRAKEYCDYLVVGVHKDASHKGKKVYIPFDQRVQIVSSIKYVDKVIMSKPEDIDVYDEIQFDYLFVGSDYKGTERFNRYEEFLRKKGKKVIYFPYTQNVSSTELRANVDKKDLYQGK